MLRPKHLTMSFAAQPKSILESMDDRRDYLEEHQAELRQLVNSVFSPRFDQNYAAYLVLGRHGRDASSEQRSRFTEALYDVYSEPLRARSPLIHIGPSADSPVCRFGRRRASDG